MEVLNMRKFASLTLALIVAGGVMIATPATAAVKITNGVACTKAGAVSKTADGTYKCAKNLLTTSTKLTWLSTDCLTMTSAYLTAKATLPAAKISTDKALAGFDAEIVAQNKVLADSLIEVDAYKVKLADTTAKLAALKADTANLAKNKLNIAAYESAVTNYNKAIATVSKVSGSTGAVQRAITRIQNFKIQALASYENLKADLTNGLANAKLLCSKGF